MYAQDDDLRIMTHDESSASDIWAKSDIAENRASTSSNGIGQANMLPKGMAM